MILIAPTVKNRIQSLDVLRGFAILGILIANIWSFGWPSFGSSFGMDYPVTGTNNWAEGLRDFLVTGKMRGLLCLLFGAGLYLQLGKLRASNKWPWGYAKRTLLLSVIGIIHIVFLWYGDILFMYSIVALTAMLFVKLDDKILLGLAIAFLCLTSLCGIGSTAMNVMSNGDQTGGLALFNQFAPENELRVYATGTFVEQLQLRVMQSGLILSALPVFIFEMLGLFLIGFWMAKKGLFQRPSAHVKAKNVLVTVGIIGLLLNLAIGIVIATTGEHSYSSLLEFGFNAPFSIGYAIVGALIVEARPMNWFAKLVGPVGQMALTSYLSQSLLCTIFFYSWGFKMFGKINYWGLYGVVLGVWACNILFAHFWLKSHKMGPVEYVWRRLAMGKPAIDRAGKEIVADNSVPPVVGFSSLESPLDGDFRNGD